MALKPKMNQLNFGHYITKLFAIAPDSKRWICD